MSYISSSPSSSSSSTSSSPPSSASSGPSPTYPDQTVGVPPQSAPYYRRMTPQEDLMATLLGIDVLVRQRQDMINQLMNHHQRLSRQNEIGSLTNFSKEIDRIMKMRGFVMKTPDMKRKMKRNATRFDQDL
ncbi:hypothetical protein TCAL_17023 [Tigriopus californicus]|uniref:Uncharacterized protein n=1 Tax=Tigriopus californicus TaxID=6832 RepID=A0A553PFS8_TIGCA|nr:uncharacterized protein LOC131881286 [Tigriopus californicus]TRY76532.1 hypothetical protein TCAL_17023 [Tigriopus californicus]